jgi:inner membrane protein YidH
MPDAPVKAEQPALDIGTKLAVDRTRIAFERTMMAWIRTATSLITFGFSVYKFFAFEMKKDVVGPLLLGPRGFGLALIGIGLLSLLFGTIDHARDVRALRQQYPAIVPSSKAAVIALAVGTLGLLAMAATILNL